MNLISFTRCVPLEQAQMRSELLFRTLYTVYSAHINLILLFYQQKANEVRTHPVVDRHMGLEIEGDYNGT